MTRYKMKVARFAVTLLTVCSVVQLLGVGTSYADDTRVRKKFKDRIMVVQPKPVLQRNRVEIIPTFRASLNDQVVQNFSVGATINYHILESLYVGATFDWGDFGSSFGGITGFAKEVSQSTGATPDGIKLNWDAFVEIGYVPIMGKLAIFNSAIGYYDLSIYAGGGYLAYEPILENQTKYTGGGVIGLTARAFLADWCALTLSLRDVIFMGEFGPGDNDSTLTNIVSAGLGFSIYIPFSFQYSQADLTKEGSLNLSNEAEQ